MKIVLNKCFGSFGLSQAATDLLPMDVEWSEYANRTDVRLVEVVELLGPGANGRHADLSIIIVPEDATDWTIEDYDGIETILYVLDGKIHRA